MAVPRNRHSLGRSKRGRAHHALTAAHMSACKACGASKLPHRVCPECGTYRGRVLREQPAEAAE